MQNKLLKRISQNLRVFHIFILVSLCSSLNLFAQSDSSYAELNLNNIKAGFASNGTLFKNINDIEGDAGFIFSSDEDTAAMIYTAQLWAAGIIGNDTLVAANTYV